jgi:hypothetical protein
MHLANRYGPMTDEKIITADEKKDKFLVTSSFQDRKMGLIIPKVVEEGEVITQLDLSEDNPKKFKVSFFKIENGQVQAVPVQEPDKQGKILHGTQILGHVKDACDMQEYAHENDSLGNWEFAFPPTTRRSVNQATIEKRGVPTQEVTRNWSYSPETDTLTGDYRQPESFDAFMGFLAANTQLCLDVAQGKFPIVSTNFKQEGYLLKLINPNIDLTGINFTFIDGKPGERAPLHEDLPKFQVMLRRVQDSLDRVPEVLRRISGKELAPSDWWRITEEKMADLDVLFYRTFSLSHDIPNKIAQTAIVQIPHPIPTAEMPREEARGHLSTVIGREVEDKDKVIILAGESSDGSFAHRLREVTSFVSGRDDALVVMPLNRHDQRLNGVDLNPNMYPIGFREDWMDIISGADVSFIRGSWGEILDVVAARIVPIISAPGVVPDQGAVDDIQFLTEVSGERASNLSLFIKELQKQGVSSSILRGLLCDVGHADDSSEIKNALEVALNEDVMKVTRSALLNIKGNGIKWMVDLHERMRSKTLDLSSSGIQQLHHDIWT